MPTIQLCLHSFLGHCFINDTCYKSLSASLVWSHLRLRLRQKRIQAIGHKNNFFLTMFDFGIFVELCSSLFLEIVYAGIGQMMNQFDSSLSQVNFIFRTFNATKNWIEFRRCQQFVLLYSYCVPPSALAMLKVTKSQKQFFLKFHCPKSKWNF